MNISRIRSILEGRSAKRFIAKIRRHSICEQPLLAIVFSFLLAVISPSAGAAEISFSTVVTESFGPLAGEFSPGNVANISYELDANVPDNNVAPDLGTYPGATLSLNFEFPDLGLIIDFAQGTVQTFNDTANPDDQVFIFGAVNQNNAMLGGESILAIELDFGGTTSMLSSDALPSSILTDLTSITLFITTTSGFTQINFSTAISPLPGAAVCELTTGSDQVIVNFDLTGQNPMPPYTNIQFGAAFDPSDPVLGSDRILTFLYGGADGTDLLQTRNDAETGFGFNAEGTVYGPLTTGNPIFDPMLDGIFSIGFQMTVGTAKLQSVTVAGQDGAMVTPDITIVPCETIIVDPGAIGSTETFFRMFFDELTGTPLDGRTVDLDIEFADMKDIEWIPGPGQLSRSLHIDLFTDTSGFDIRFLPATGSVTDENGAPVGPPLLTGESFLGPTGFGGVDLRFEPTVGVVFNGATFSFTLPTVPGTITAAAMTLSQSQIGGGVYTIGGPLAPLVVVPADECTVDAGGCNPTGGHEVVLPENFVVPPGGTITQTATSFVDPRVDQNGRCDGQTPLVLFGGELIIPPHLCGSPEFEVLETVANFDILEGTVLSTMYPEVFVNNALELHSSDNRRPAIAGRRSLAADRKRRCH